MGHGPGRTRLQKSHDLGTYVLNRPVHLSGVRKQPATFVIKPKRADVDDLPSANLEFGMRATIPFICIVALYAQQKVLAWRK